MINLTFTAWPEMLAWPYLTLQGWLPYRDIAIAHNPLLLLDLVIFFKLFGIGIIQLKIFTWILIAANVYLTYYVGKKFWSKNIGLLSSFLYLILCIIFEGNGLWFDLALSPFALLLYLFLKEKKYVWAGVFFVLGFLTKQTFIYFAVPTIFYILQSTFIKKNIANFIIGSGIVISIFIVILSLLGIMDDYYNWAIKFGILYLPTAVGQISLPSLKQLVFAVVPFVFLIFNSELLIINFALFGALGVYPRWELFHFQPALPFLALIISIFIFSNKKVMLKALVIFFGLIYITYGLYRQVGSVTRFFESDVQKVSSEITKRYPLSSNLYVINYWDNIYALTNTKPSKPLIPYIPWYLNYGESKNIILNNLKSETPDAIVIGQRGNEFPEIYSFVEKYYTCNIVEKRVELCEKN
jgi:hypothetical protein